MIVPAIGLLQLALLAAAGFVAGIAVVCAGAYPLLRSAIIGIGPARRAWLLRMLIAAPLGGALALTALCFLPSLLGVLWPQVDHCHGHHGHVHLCLLHPPDSMGGWLGWAIGTAFWACLGTAIAGVLWRARRSARRLGHLQLVSRFDAVIGVHVVDAPLPFSSVIGVVRQRIVLSSALATALPKRLLQVVLAHEAGHARRRDGLWQLVGALLAVAHLPRTRRLLLADVAVASEQACDEHADEVIRDRLAVARAILAVERLLGDRTPGALPAPGFGGGDVAARIEALLAPPSGPPRRRTTVALIAIAAVAAALAASDALHHWTETALGLLVG